jgi:hypothetical protein
MRSCGLCEVSGPLATGTLWTGAGKQGSSPLVAPSCHTRGFSHGAVGVDSGALGDPVGDHGQHLGEGQAPRFDVALGPGLPLENPPAAGLSGRRGSPAPCRACSVSAETGPYGMGVTFLSRSLVRAGQGRPTRGRGGCEARWEASFCSPANREPNPAWTTPRVPRREPGSSGCAGSWVPSSSPTFGRTPSGQWPGP